MSKNEPKLRIQHYPQIPCEPFTVHVKDIYEAHKTMNILANYDLFQHEHKIKPDYSNMTVLEVFDKDEQDWCDWFDDETGIGDLDEYFAFIKDNPIEIVNG